MKLNKFLSITLLAGALMLSACGSKGNDDSAYSEVNLWHVNYLSYMM